MVVDTRMKIKRALAAATFFVQHLAKPSLYRNLQKLASYGKKNEKGRFMHLWLVKEGCSVSIV